MLEDLNYVKEQPEQNRFIVRHRNIIRGQTITEVQKRI